MEGTIDSTDMSLDDIHMKSSELLDKKEIDCGGFGKVYLCCHKKHGLVVQKTVFTGFKHDSYKNDLIQEGQIMCKLNNRRVVKLLGVILEDGNYSLVIEYMTKGNLLNVLKQVQVPYSVRARFIVEITEGMIYLHSQKVIHKDLKPENILADDDFHVKIADLGVAAFQKWSTLTKEETNRQRSRSSKTRSAKASGAGTLCYMAPEHFKDINQKATKKSDVYSFGIVIWVILNSKEPYENVINEAQLSICVQDGQRPDMTEDIQESLKEAADLMKECWKDDPNERPSFEDCEKQFMPVYCEKYEKDIKRDMAKLQKEYPKPEPFIARMASLQIDCDAELPSMQTRDTPQSLHSSLGLGQQNVNENLFRASNEPVECEEETHNEDLQRKLQDEINYHQMGSRFDNVTNPSNSANLSELKSRRVFNDPGKATSANQQQSPQQPAQMAPGHTYEHVPRPYELHYNYVLPKEHQRMFNPHLSAMSTNTPQPEAHPHAQCEDLQGLHGSMVNDYTKVPVAESGKPTLFPQHTNYPFVSDISHTVGTIGNNFFPKGNFGWSESYAPASYNTDKPINVTISNSRAVQIGNGNYMLVENPPPTNMHFTQNMNHEQYQHLFGNNLLVNEHQIHLLTENLSKKWKEFARKVGFRQPEIEEIDHDYERDGLKEKVFQMLYKWQMKEGSKNATVGKVAKALYDLGEKDLLMELIQLNNGCANT
ncbi:receptor-interacting serine/threonine-protein kinase 1 [Pyxicephalus adspersus]|uniref:receptor-interacting serine/threonine-protein kinase 1 n=1 Tax=Pyxicephalus adspersus TaxID=30357 RepID=UPI003B5C882D